MAQREIGFSVKINNAESLKQVDKLVSEIQKKANIKLDIATGEGLSSLKAMQETLSTIEKAISTAFNGKSFNTSGIERVNKEGKEVKETFERIVETQGKISKESLTEYSSGASKEVREYNEGLGQTLKIIENINKEGKITSSSETLSINHDKILKDKQNTQNKLDTTQNLINKLGSNGFYNNSFISTLQKELNELNIDTPIAKIEELMHKVQMLGSGMGMGMGGNEDAIIKLQRNIDGFDNKITSLKSKYKGIVPETELNRFDELLTGLKTRLDGMKNGDIVDSKKLSSEINQVTNSFEELKNASVKVQEEAKAQEKLQQRVQAMKSSVGTKGETNGLVNNNLIDESVITNIQARLNAINTDTPEAEIKALETEIKNLGSSEPQIVRVQNAINSMKTGLEGMKGKYGSLVGNSDSIDQLTTYENKIKELEGILKQLQSGKSFDGATISRQLNQASNASRELTTAVRSSSSALKLNQQDALSFGDSLKRALSVTGIYTGVYQAVMMLKTAIKDAVSYIKYLDQSLKYVDELM